MAAATILKKARRSAGVSASRRVARSRRHFRLRKKVVGTAERPRLVVTRSSRHLYAQIFDDSTQTTLASASTYKLREGDKTAKAKALGTSCRGEGRGYLKVVDRGGHTAPGRMAAFADAAREAGLEYQPSEQRQ
jgi:large subunit ribosomal protein L18